MQQKLLLKIDEQRTANGCLFLSCVRSIMNKLHNLTVGMSVFVNVNFNTFKSSFVRHEKLRMKRKQINHILVETMFSAYIVIKDYLFGGSEYV